MSFIKELDLHEACLPSALVLAGFVLKLFTYRIDSFATGMKDLSSHHLWLSSEYWNRTLLYCYCLENECHLN